jgi:hypothetical protein
MPPKSWLHIKQIIALFEKGIDNVIFYLSLSPKQWEARKKAKVG